ncbi:MAG: magnesium transporter CorA family protein [Hyphomicrobiaceae bacterium]
MLRVYEPKGGCLVARDDTTLTREALWIDLTEPTPEEDAAVEKHLGISIPTRAEAREIEASSRLYAENGAHYMTAFVLYNAESDVPGGATVTFVLSATALVTIRYHEPRAFPLFAARAGKGELACSAPAHVLMGLLETIIDRAADVTERIQDRMEGLTGPIFGGNDVTTRQSRKLDETLRAVGRQGDITARLEESAFSLERLLIYLGTVLKDRGDSKATIARTKTAIRDIRSLTEQMRFLSDRITFLLDATLGAINIQQNQIIKIFSLVSVTLMPPTLVGSIYGMNFKRMPELDWPWGYPLALSLMVVVAVLPYLYFRRKGWL